MHLLKPVFLHGQAGSRQDLASSVSGWNEENEWSTQIFASSLTAFTFNALAKCCTPLQRIRLHPSTNFVSAYLKYSRQTINRDVQKLSYRIYLQCASQMLCSFMSDAIVPQTKRCECLREMEMGIEWSRSIDAVLLYSLAIHLLNIVLLRHRPCYNQDRVWSMSVWNENDEGLVKV